MSLRIGISMRETRAQAYVEDRDTLARDWAVYMTKSFSDSMWMYIPNIEEDAVSYFQKWDLNVLFLTGGDDIGMYPCRDKTELLLLKHAIDNQIPVIAVCRGMQLVNTYFGGHNNTGDSAFAGRHRAKLHQIKVHGTMRMVNSYHNNYIDENSLSREFEVIARDKNDSSIEGFKGKGILAMMWHPERKGNDDEWNTSLIKKFIKDTI